MYIHFYYKLLKLWKKYESGKKFRSILRMVSIFMVHFVRPIKTTANRVIFRASLTTTRASNNKKKLVLYSVRNVARWRYQHFSKGLYCKGQHVSKDINDNIGNVIFQLHFNRMAPNRLTWWIYFHIIDRMMSFFDQLGFIRAQLCLVVVDELSWCEGC